MPPVEFNDLASIGVVADMKPYMVPPEAWTTALNVRATDGDMEQLLGWEQVFGTPGVAPHFAIPIRTASATFWLYVSLTKAYGYDGTTHTDITRLSGNYTASNTREWNATLLSSTPIINNGVNIPQFWGTISLGTKLLDLTNWPATLRARVIRAFGPYLMALGISKSGTQYPHMIKWSHPADPGSIPSSWDETDPTKDAGENDLPDVNAGILIDMMPLSDTMYIFKENSVWKCRFVGGRFIFDFGKSAWLTTTGILAPRCVAVTGDGTRQVWASQDDILWHDGNTVRSVLDGRRRREIFDAIDTTNYQNCFLFDNPQKKEIWFCYPPAGQTNPTKALLMNYRNAEVFTLTDADGITFRNASVGPIQSPSDITWAADTVAWSTSDGPWSEMLRRRVVLCGTDATKFYNLDKGTTRDGVSFTATLQRLALSVLGKKRNGDWITDFNRMKMFDVMWPKISGNAVSIRLGAHQLVDGAVTWNPAVTYTPATDVHADAGPVSGRALALEISGSNGFRASGYSMDIKDIGNF